jgi:Rnl2 family RNA ligase
MTNFRKFPSIEQYRNVIKKVRDYSRKYEIPLPTLQFTGTVKLHGTNAAIGYNSVTDEMWCQSRERIITPFDDNAGFARFVKDNETFFRVMLAQVCGAGQIAIIYGEWAGPGIQSGVAISNIEKKTFFIFDIVFYPHDSDGETVTHIPIDFYKDHFLKLDQVKLMTDFPQYTMNIDFTRPELSQNELVNLTVEVETECPVGRQMGVTGIGEGIVWRNEQTGLMFKVKGEKHSTSKVRTVKEIAAVDLERMNTVAEFVANVVTENRLNQGIAKLGEMGLDVDIKNTGAFIKWIMADVLREEMDLIEASCIEKKDLMSKLAMAAKTFYMKVLQEDINTLAVA